MEHSKLAPALGKIVKKLIVTENQKGFEYLDHQYLELNKRYIVAWSSKIKHLGDQFSSAKYRLKHVEV